MDTNFIATNLPIGVGCMLVGSGLYGVVSPLNTIRYFGLPWAQEPHSRIYPAVGARNLSAGLATILLSLTGDREAVGILLASWAIVGMIDTKVVISHGEKVAVHAINTCIIALVGALAWQEGHGPKWIDHALVAGLIGVISAMVVNSWLLS